MTEAIRVAVLGAGGIGLASAAILAQAGHRPVLWSPSGRGLAEVATSGLEARGAVDGRYSPSVAATLRDAIEGAPAVLIALPANGRRQVFDALVPVLTSGQTVIVSAELSLGALWLHRRIMERGIAVDVVAWSTTAVMGRRTAPAQVTVGGIRSRVEAAALPDAAEARALALCAALFGPRFVPAGGMAAILLGNLNPEVHMANALCNLTRIEKAESWANYDGISPAVARLIGDLDRERLALAAELGLTVRSVEQHFRQSFGLPEGMTLAEMAAELHRLRGGPPGPTSLETRFLTEDVPFGVLPLIRLAKARGQVLPLHEAGFRLLSSLCGRDFSAENDLPDQTGYLELPLSVVVGSGAGYSSLTPCPRTPRA